jgi:hypothetical protein
MQYTVHETRVTPVRASTCSPTRKTRHQPPWGMTLNSAAESPLPSTLGDLLAQDGVALAKHTMRQAPVEAFPVSGAASLPVCQPGWGRAWPHGFAPGLPALPSWLDTSIGEVVVRVVGATLPIQMALRPSHRPVILGKGQGRRRTGATPPRSAW